MKNNSNRIIVSILVTVLIMSAISVSAILTKNAENQLTENRKKVVCQTQGDIMPKPFEENIHQLSTQSELFSNSSYCSIISDMKPPIPTKSKNNNQGS